MRPGLKLSNLQVKLNITEFEFFDYQLYMCMNYIRNIQNIQQKADLKFYEFNKSETAKLKSQ